MKNKCTPFLLLLFLVLLGHACSTASFTQTDLATAAQRWPGTTLHDLQQGQVLYASSCAHCHALKSPESQDEAGWNKWVPVMSQKAHLNDHDRNLIWHYLLLKCNPGN